MKPAMARPLQLAGSLSSLTPCGHGTATTSISHASSSSLLFSQLHSSPAPSLNHRTRGWFRASYRFSSSDGDDGDEYAGGENFDGAVALFNDREYYRCHDVLEALWNGAEEPRRTLFHGILQCAVGFHHLFNQNHKGAMMELGEGLCKLRKMNFDGGPFYEFEQEISAALNFIYQTQIELAACAEDLCITMDGSERSYQLLGGYAAGQNVYTLQQDPDDGIAYIIFSPERSVTHDELLRVKLPTLGANNDHLCNI